MNKKNRIKKRSVRILLLALAAAVSIGIGYTLATVLLHVDLKNTISTPTVTNKIVEETGDPGQKEVKFQNTGSADAFIRVAYAETWKYHDPERNEDQLLSNTVDGKPIAVPKWLWEDGKDWQKGDDGWWYYKKVLPAKGTDGNETDYVLKEVNFDAVDNIGDETLRDKYKAAEYELHFTVESVQASDEWQVSLDAIRHLFGEYSKITIDDPNQKSWTTRQEMLDSIFSWDIPTEKTPVTETEEVKGND